jgi:AbrB family looped-hinge helix DNA binding protein
VYLAEGTMADEPLIDVTRVSDKGQVVIPKEIRDKLGFAEGTRLIVVAAEDAVILQRVEVVAGKVRVRELMDRIKSVTQRLAFGRG